jgi:hypothetical protein
MMGEIPGSGNKLEIWGKVKHIFLMLPVIKGKKHNVKFLDYTVCNDWYIKFNLRLKYIIKVNTKSENHNRYQGYTHKRKNPSFCNTHTI